MREILIVEDDLPAANMLAQVLKAQGFGTAIVDNGLEVVAQVKRREPALILLDVMLPGQDGVAVCREVRRFSAVPIIMLTARMEEIDRLAGLEMGADDYVCKTLSSPREVVARINALLRRTEGRLGTAAPAHGFRVDEGAMRIAWGEQWLPLTPLEYRLFKQMLARPGQVFARSDLLGGLQDEFRDTTDRAIDTHIKNLRRKIGALRPQGSGIVSVYGVGYRFDPQAQETGT